MRKKNLLILAIFLITASFIYDCAVIRVFIPPKKSGWDRYFELLQNLTKGLTPYWMPNSSDGPGTILEIVDGAEQLFYRKEESFPKIVSRPDDVPQTFISEVSRISFKIGTNADDRKILPSAVEATASLAYEKNTDMSLTIGKSKLYRIPNGLFKEALMNFDLKNPRHATIFEKLIESNARLVSGSLFVEGFTFVFNNVKTLNTTLEAKLTQGFNKANVNYDRISNNKFEIQADSSMFIAYYAYPITENLKKLHRIMEIEQIENPKIAQKIRQNSDKLLGWQKELSSSNISKEQSENLNKDIQRENEVINSDKAMKESNDLELKELKKDLKKEDYKLFGDEVIIPHPTLSYSR